MAFIMADVRKDQAGHLGKPGGINGYHFDNSLALGVIGLCLVIGGKTRARPKQAWVWYVCGVFLIGGGILYKFSAPAEGRPCVAGQAPTMSADGKLPECVQDMSWKRAR